MRQIYCVEMLFIEFLILFFKIICFYSFFKDKFIIFAPANLYSPANLNLL